MDILRCVRRFYGTTSLGALFQKTMCLPLTKSISTSNIAMSALFAALLNHLVKFVTARATAEERRHDLWYVLAEPISGPSKATAGLDPDIVNVSEFWRTVVKDAHARAGTNKAELLQSIVKVYTLLRPMLNCNVEGT